MKQIKDKSQVILFVVTALLLITNISLIYQNLNLRSQLSGSRPLQVAVGDRLNEFQTKNLNGIETKINYSEDDKKRILLFFKTTCGYCQKQMTYWKELVSGANGQNYKVTAITTETDVQAIEDYKQKYKIQDWEVLIINPEEAQTAKLLATPITIIADNEGIVEKVWTGLWQNNDVDSAGKYFALNFSETAKTK